MKNLTNFPIEFINNAKITDNDSTYIIVKATNADDKQCLVKIESNVGVCEAVTAQTDSVSYSYKLSALTKNSAGNPEFNLTQMKSGRIYVSLKYPLKLHIDSSNPNKMAIIDPDGFKTRDSNYYTVYDKFEFTFNEDGLWINPTSVDFFSIPIKLSLPTSPDLKSSGFSDKRSDILASVWKEFSQSVSSNEWNKLFLNFDSGTTLRAMAPGKAMRDTGPGSNPTFASDYLANNKFGLNYIDKVWDYYKTNTIKVDCSELAGDKDFNPKLKDYVFTGQIKNDEFTFSNSRNESILSIAKPESISFFA
ncbi:beta-1,3-glucanase family protein [Candidatus Bandiella numerosa]|uniref:beta-1,3-glucanase family protein n=1 Tax=Candidatus Bandiella numerosa TaxID=2570586 RepID=UPI00249DE456|nr:beta-1,3-glucanase family protein [Candidatus Bandiella numerosa]WHA05413.1 beta-1,3-glucanase family protein [Candidatus Bandiella numerosa]